MKKTRIDRQQDFLMNILRPLVYVWMYFDAKRKVIVDKSYSFRRKEPYVLLANHTFLFDVVHVPLRTRIVPFIIASQTLFTKQPAKFLVTQVAHVISKAKGRSDAKTIMNIFSVVKKGYPILIFPEGDTTFYGETNYIEESTMKLIKKLNLDVVTCNVRGGYLSKPRWATGKRRNPRVELYYELSIPKEKLESMSLEDINSVVKEKLYHNAYDYQRQAMIPHPGKQLAEGMENVVYVCPHCKAILSIETKGNTIRCNACGKEGHIDEYGFIHDFVYDNLIDWNKFQRNFRDELRASKVSSTGLLAIMDAISGKQTPLGEVTLQYENNVFTMSGALEKTIPLSELSNPTITLRRDFGFVHQDEHFIIKLDHYSAAFLRIVQEKY